MSGRPVESQGLSCYRFSALRVAVRLVTHSRVGRSLRSHSTGHALPVRIRAGLHALPYISLVKSGPRKVIARAWWTASITESRSSQVKPSTSSS